MSATLSAESSVPRGGVALSDGLPQQIELFLHHLAEQRRVAPNTVSAYGNDLRQFSQYLNAPGELEASIREEGLALDQGNVAGFVLHLREKGYAQATVARKVAAVKAFFHYAAEFGLIPHNPAASVDSP